jgi:DNA-binding IclR family transcriptional regulator
LATHHRAVDRITTILEYAVATPGGTTLTDLTRILDAPKSSLHALVQGLIAVGYLSESGGRLTVGPSARCLTQYLQMPHLVRLARPYLEEIAQMSGETTLLGTRMGNNIVYQAEVASERPIRFVPNLNERRPLFPTSLGRLFLSDLTPKDLATLLDSEQYPAAKRPGLYAALDRIRERGVAINRGDSVPGLDSVAAPIRDSEEQVVAGITVAGPDERMSDQLQPIADVLLRVTARIEAALNA